VKLRMPKPPCPLPSIALAVASLLIAGLAALAAQPADQGTSHLPELVVSDSHRFLTTSDGRPFFWLGDSAWELFHRLNRDEAEHYLKRRAEQGFTVIQAVVLSELDGLKTPNAYGQLPLESNDPGRPNEKYFEHVDWVVAKATLAELRDILDKWIRETNDQGQVPESEEIYDADMEVYLGSRKDEPDYIATMKKNIAQMKAWAKEGR